MFIRNRNNYLLLENLKQAREYLTKKNFPLDLPEFQHIVKSLDKLPNLIDPFTRMIFQYDLNDIFMRDVRNKLEIFDRIVDWIKNNKHLMSKLPKNISQYKNLEHLEDDISHLKRDQEIHKFIKSLYRSMRDEVKELDGDKAEQFRELAYAFMQLDDEKKSQFTPLKYFEKNDVSIEGFMSSLNTFVNGQDTNENKKRIYKYIEDNPDKVNVIYDKNNVLVIQTNDGPSVCELGSQRWCIVYAPGSYQKQYFGPETGNTQYIIHNFNLPSSSKYSMFGVTIDIEGNTKGGGAQNKENGGMRLEKIYELTEIPEGTLVSIHKEEYDELLSDMVKINYESSYQDVLHVRKSSLKLGVGSKTRNLVETWLDNYIEDQKLYNIEEDQKFIDEISRINKMSEELDTRVNLDSVKEKFMKRKVDESRLYQSESLEKLNKNIMYYKILCDTLNIDSNFLTLESFGWFTNNVTDNASEIISLIYKMASNEYDKLFKENIGKYLDKYHKDTIKILIDEITKDKETLNRYFLDENQLIEMLQIPFKDYISNTNSLDLTDTIYLYYVFMYHIVNSSLELDLRHLPDNKLTIGLIEDYLKSSDIVVDRLLEVPLQYKERELTRSDIESITKGDNSIIVEHYMDLDNRESFEEIRYGYKMLREYLKDDDDDDNYIVGNLFKIYEKFETSDYDGMLDFFTDLSIKEYYDITDSLERDNIYDTSEIDDDYMKFIGQIMIDSKVNIDSYTNHIVNYSAGLVDQKYMDKFFNEIGLTYHPEYKKWYMETDYDTLGGYFENEFNFEDFWDYGHWNDYDYSNDCIGNVDIGNLSILSKYFKANGFDIDITPLEKYNYKENLTKWGNIKTNYKDSMDFYRTDKELSQLLSTVESIVTQSYDYEEEQGGEDDPYENIDIDEIKGYISGAYQRAEESARESEYFDKQASVIGDAFLEQWPDESRSFGDSYFMWNDKSDGILVIPDLDVLIDGNWYDMISYQCGEDDITIDCMISAHQDDQGKLSNATEDGYVYFEDSHYEHYNEELTNLLGENNIETETEEIKENIILKLSDYLSEMKLSELNNPERFISEFGGDEERAKDDLEYYTEVIEDLNSNGGEIYRLVFLEDMSDLNIDELGEHWCIDSDQLSNFYNSLDDQIGLPYLITAQLEPNQVNVELSYGQYEQLPYELEVNLLSDPKKYDIKPYKDTHKAKQLWESVMY